MPLGRSALCRNQRWLGYDIREIECASGGGVELLAGKMSWPGPFICQTTGSKPGPAILLRLAAFDGPRRREVCASGTPRYFWAEANDGGTTASIGGQSRNGSSLFGRVGFTPNCGLSPVAGRTAKSDPFRKLAAGWNLSEYSSAPSIAPQVEASP